ncbi:hypothetical protein LSTR_LSTR000687 [Laodelphax striatellus]|uniref:Uncharacterized protein n=1 Tax=Laodelphax striatellus TaxID=195883 RepID=A0A482XFC5_LAOST|nr:hypothetical protein LSTR_LSTR000687 [Laodelphax striatellus]
MEVSQAFHPATLDSSIPNAGNEDEFGSALKKIIDRQSDLVKVRDEFKKENETLTNNLRSIKQQNEEFKKKRETFKLLVVREQDNFDNVNSSLIKEMLTIKTLFENVDNASKLANDFIKKNSIVSSFFDGISRNYNDLQESISHLVSRITQENMHIKEKVTTSKLYKEKYESDLQNDIVQCELDLENISNAVSCLKKAIFEKHLELSKLSVTAEYVCEEESKDELNLQHLETKLKELSIDGKNNINEKETTICDLEKREETLRSTLLEMENDEKILRQSIDTVQQNLRDLEKCYRERELDEKSSNEKLQVLNDTINKLAKIKSSLHNDLKAKEDLNQDNEKMSSALLDLEKKYKEQITEKEDLESDIDFLQNDMKVYLAEIESEKRNQLEETATKEKFQTDTYSMNVQSNELNEKHNENASLMEEEIENSKRRLNESDIALLQIQTSNANKTQQLNEYQLQLEDCRNALAIRMEKLNIETKKIEEYEKIIQENQKKYSENLEEINSTFILKKEELNAAEIRAERLSSLEKEIDKAKSELGKQTEQIQSELQQIENDNLCCKNDAEERFETFKIQLENKNKKIKTELLEYQAGLTELENVEKKVNVSTASIKNDLKILKKKNLQLLHTRDLLHSRVSEAKRNLKSAINYDKSDNVSISQVSSVVKPQDDDDDEDSSSGISTSDPRWAIPKRKSGDSSLGERSQKK